MGVWLFFIAVLYTGWGMLGQHYLFGGIAENVPTWYMIIGLIISIGLPTYIGMKLDSPGPSYSPDGYPGWWNRD